MDRKEINFDEKRLNELYEGKKTIKPYVLRSMINYYENRQQKKNNTYTSISLRNRIIKLNKR